MQACWVHLHFSSPSHLPQYKAFDATTHEETHKRTHIYKQRPLFPHVPPFIQTDKTSVFTRIKASWVGTVTDGANDVCPSKGSTLVQARLATYAQSQGHQRRKAALRVREPPQWPFYHDSTITEMTLNKQGIQLCLLCSLHCFSIWFFQHHTLPLHVPVSSCYFLFPYAIHPSFAFSPQCPHTAWLDGWPFALVIWVPVGAPSFLCRNLCAAKWQNKFGTAACLIM